MKEDIHTHRHTTSPPAGLPPAGSGRGLATTVTVTLAVTLTMMLAGCGSDDAGGAAADNGNGNGGGDSNAPPIVDAGEHQTVAAGDTVVLDGSATDPDGDDDFLAGPRSIEWTQDSGPEVDLSSTVVLQPSFEAPEVDADTELAFTLSVTDEDGERASDSTTVTVTPAVALSGRVFDGPIPNAAVTVSVGDETFTAQADADGVYTVKVSNPDPEAMVTITATGDEGQETVELVSIAGSFGALKEAAGDDGTVDADEAPGVEVSHLSTAKSVLVIEANDGEAPADQATLEDRERDVDTEELLDLAVAIKLVIDEGEDLPEGTESTLELVEDQEALETFQAGVDPEAADAVAEEVVATQAQDAAFTAEELGAAPVALYRPYAHNFPTGRFIEFAADGSGAVMNPGGEVSMSWTISEAGLVDVVFDEPLVTVIEACGGVPGDLSGSCRTETEGFTIKRVLRGTVSDSVVLEETATTTFPEHPELEPVTDTSEFTRSTVKFDRILPFTAEELAGRTLASNCCQSSSDRLFRLMDGGAGMNADTGESVAWTVDEGVLELTLADGGVAEIFKLRSAESGQFEGFALADPAEGDRFASEGLVAISDGSVDALEAEDVVGRLVLFGGPDHGRNNPQADGVEFGFDLAADGSGTNFNTHPDSGFEQAMGWELQAGAEGPTLILRRCFSKDADDWIVPTTDAELTLENCWFYNRRAWRLVSFDGAFLYHNTDRDFGNHLPDGSTVEFGDQLTRFYSFEPAETAKAGMSTGRGGEVLPRDEAATGRDLLITLFDEGPVASRYE